MDFSIKSPKALLWKTGYDADQLKNLYEARKLEDDWLVCPLGDSASAVTIAEFIQNPSIFRKYKNAQVEPLSVAPSERPMTVAAMGWWVFFGALTAHFLLALIASDLASNSVGNLGRSYEPYSFITTLFKGLDALIVAGAIAALIGHAYAKITKAEQDSADQSTTRPE